MYSLKPSSFFRPSSRPSSPAPPSSRVDSVVAERPSRSSMLSFSNFKRTASPITRSAAPLVQDGSYMELLNLKLSEAVSKALAQPTGPAVPSEALNGRRPIPPGRGRALGDIIVSEINASHDNAYLYRAVIRTLHRPLSVLVNNLSGNLLPLLSSPDFLAPVVPSSQHVLNLNPTQLHAIGYSTLAGELLDMFDEVGLGLDGNDMRGDGLKVVRDGLVSIVKRVVEPFVNRVKTELLPHIEALERLRSNTGTGQKTVGIAKSQHPSIIHLQTVMPTYSRALTRYITSATAEAILASFIISLIWRGLVALAHRPTPPATPPTSPSLIPAMSKANALSKRRGSSITPPTTPPASRFMLKLPPSRPPSPPGSPGDRNASAAADASALYNLLWSLPRPTGESSKRRLAREAVEDAFDALSSLAALLDAVHFRTNGTPSKTPNTRQLCTGGITELQKDLELLTADLPTLIALPVVLQAYVFPTLQPQPHPALLTTAPGAPGSNERSAPSILGISESSYRSGCLAGFGRAEECTVAVGQRVLDVLKDEVAKVRCGNGRVSESESEKLKEVDVVMKWLEKEVLDAANDAAAAAFPMGGSGGGGVVQH